MARSIKVLIFWCVLIGTSAFAAQAILKPQTQGDVQFISGGVGVDEHKAMRAIQGEYNLHLIFAVKGTGEFVSNVKIKIADAHRKIKLDTISDGPDFFAKMAPGRYNLVADRDGHIIKESIMVPHMHGTFIVLYFPIEKGD